MNDTEHVSTRLDKRSIFLRRLVVRALIGGGRGHIGSSLSLIELIRVIYDDFLKFDPKNPFLEERDRFILSKGHGCLALYAVLADKGFFDKTELDKFCHNDGILGGHPERGKVPGVEATTGPLRKADTVPAPWASREHSGGTRPPRRSGAGPSPRWVPRPETTCRRRGRGRRFR